jgi:hypothetical protein
LRYRFRCHGGWFTSRRARLRRKNGARISEHDDRRGQSGHSYRASFICPHRVVARLESGTLLAKRPELRSRIVQLRPGLSAGLQGRHRSKMTGHGQMTVFGLHACRARRDRKAAYAAFSVRNHHVTLRRFSCPKNSAGNSKDDS